MNLNGIMMQFFEWYMPSGILWNKITEESERLAEEGVTALWVPPPYKGDRGLEEQGYAVYDLYDLGEFDQKGTVPTKYGTKDEFLKAIKTAQSHGMGIYADIVLDHRMGADESEIVKAEEFNPWNRLEQVSGTEKIEAATHFYFPGRNKKYSDFEWHWYHFTGIDHNEKKEVDGIFKFKGKEWEYEVDQEHGNFDYLMGASLDLNNQEVKEELLRWGKWFMETTHIDGFRLDAVKHMKFSFYNDWLHEMRDTFKQELFTVGEYWSEDIRALMNYLETTNEALSLFDVPLHWKFHQASNSDDSFDLRDIFKDVLITENPLKAVTFVDNHDTQPGQSLESWVEEWFKPLAYSVILMRREGYPCVFYGDYYGIEHDNIIPKRDMLCMMMKVRTRAACGEQHDYFDKNVLGWTREGDDEHPGSGLAVVMSNKDEASLKMYVGKEHAGEDFFDATGNFEESLTIDDNGEAEFKTKGRSVSVWVRPETYHK